MSQRPLLVDVNSVMEILKETWSATPATVGSNLLENQTGHVYLMDSGQEICQSVDVRMHSLPLC